MAKDFIAAPDGVHVVVEHLTADPEDLSHEQVEAILRDCLAWARAQAAINRTEHPASGRAASIIATHIEEALYRLMMPVP